MLINSAADAISRTENLPTDALTAEAEARYEEDDIMDLQLPSENPDKATLRDVGTQCDLGTDTPRPDRTITVIHALANHGDRQDADETAKARTHANTSSTTPPGRLTSDSNGSSSSSKHGDKQETAADGDQPTHTK